MRAPAVWSAGQRSLRRGRFTCVWYSGCFWHIAVAGVTGGRAVTLPAQRSSAVVLGVLRSPVLEQPGSVLSHSCDRLFVGLSSECRGRAAPRPGCRCCPGNPQALPELTLNPVGAAGSCGRSHCRQSRWVEGISNSRFAVGERSRSQRWVCAVQVPKWDWGQGAAWELEQQKAESQATVLVALPCFDQRLTASGLGCVCGAGHEDPPHLPGRECHVLLHGDLRRGNTM